MKRPIFTQNSFLNLVSDYLKTTTRAFSIVLTFTLIFSNIQAQDCNIIMACNDGVQISLDENCTTTLMPDMVLEGQIYPNFYYDVEAKLPNGTSLPQIITGLDYDNRPIKRVVLTSAHVGLILKVRISLRGCANSCWGDAKIEDKLAPVVSTRPCEPRISNFSGNLSGLDGNYDRPSAVAGCPGTPDLAVRYEARSFAVDANGIVDINAPAPNVRFSLYNGTFNPVLTCNGLIATNVNTYSGNLSVGTTYILVISSVGSATPPGGINYNVFIDSRTGNVKSTVAATICTFPCNGEVGLLAQTANSASNRPLFVDACSTNLTYTKYDSVTVLTCSERYGKIIRRQWTATDPSGNVSEVYTQYFYIRRGTLAEVVCPPDWIRDCTVSYTRLDNGAPAPSVSGQPSNIACQNIQVYYVDVVFKLCGAGIKVFRQWTIIDWCTGEDKVCGQTIKIEDNVLPTLSCPTIPAISALSDRCAANWDVTPPSATDCSHLTWTVLFSKDGINLANPPADAVYIKTDGTTIILGNSPAFAPQINASARPFTITGLPLGKTWIKYIATDECNNFRECVTSVTVVDGTPPTAICQDQTIVSLDDTGWGDLFAASLNNYSLDNCGIAKYEVRRKTTTCPGYSSDIEFGPKVRFCCSDISAPASYVSVVLRVTDNAGNTNECETLVKVQNKRPATISCPPSRTLTCGDSRISAWIAGNVPFDTLFFGKPTSGGVCSDLVFGSRIINNNLNAKCGTGSVDREWFLVSNPTIRCTQRLTVVSPVFSPSSVIFPGNIVLPTCDVSKATPDILNSKPIVDNNSCRDIGISFTDQVFTNVPEACIKILRTWRVIDWCSYAQSPVIAEQTQTIKLTGSGGAQFTNCGTQSFNTDPGRCDVEVTLSANATDECTNPEDLRYTWSLDLNKDNVVDFSGVGKSFTKVLPAGTHRVTFTVTNKCGTPSSCSYDVIVKSIKKPTPVCYREVVWVMDPKGSTEIWASDFNLKSENNCGNNSRLKFSFNAAGTQLSRTFTCADIPNGQVERIPLKMYVIDENGNSDFCDVILILQDSPLTNACRDVTSLLPTVAGKITTEKNDGVEEIEVGLTNMVNASEVKSTTKKTGEYKFTGVDVFDPKSIGAYKNSDILNGVSTLDLVLIQRHILGIQPLDSPYKLLAADVNNSRNITASDLVSLRKIILGVNNSFENNTSWRFIPAEYTFLDPTFPFDFPSKINLDSIFENKSDVNFKAVKVGDVNNSVLANANSKPSEVRSGNALFVFDQRAFNGDENVQIEFRAGESMKIMGTQFGLVFNADELSYTGIKSGRFDLKASHFNLTHASNGKILVSYDIPKGVSLNAEDVLFTIEFASVGKGNTSSIKIDHSGLSPEVYEMDATVRPLSMQVREKNLNGVSNILYQNEPNPFKEMTNISFEIEKSGQVSLRIMDVTGKAVFTTKGWFDKGYNNISISNSNLPKSGVYFYQIEAGEFSATKKMILIE